MDEIKQQMKNFSDGMATIWKILTAIYHFFDRAFFLSKWAGNQVMYLYQNLLHFPPLTKWYFWVPAWLLWYHLLNTPKSLNARADKVVEYIKLGATKAGEIVTKIKGIPGVGIFLWLALWYTAFPLMIVIFLGKHGWIKKWIFYAAIINIVLAKLPLQLAYPLAIILITLWTFWFKSKEDRQKTRKIFKEQGFMKGMLTVLSQNYITFSPKNTWTCEFCGYKKNPILETGPIHHCDNCKARKPDLPWDCECKAKNPGDRTACISCGRPNPHCDDKGKSLPNYPKWKAIAPPAQAPSGNPTRPTIVMVECPHCHSNVPSGNYCISCTLPLNKSSTIGQQGAGRIRRNHMS